jgi:hypothetical protein
MPPQLSELEVLLRQLIAEHRKLLSHVQEHEAAVKALDVKVMEASGRRQETVRLRIIALEQRRRATVQQLIRGTGIQGDPNLRKLAAMFPIKAKSLLQLRAELREVIDQIAVRNHVAGKVAAAVLGHLNTLVRMISGVVERAGLYTKRGIPKVSSRIGVMDATG